MTGNGKFIPPIKMVMTGGWIYYCFTHINLLFHVFLFCYWKRWGVDQEDRPLAEHFVPKKSGYHGIPSGNLT